jgi:hypothetical protein
MSKFLHGPPFSRGPPVGNRWTNPRILYLFLLLLLSPIFCPFILPLPSPPSLPLLLPYCPDPHNCPFRAGGWAGPRASLEAVEKRKILHCRESNPGAPACSQSLYRLSYPGFHEKHIRNFKWFLYHKIWINIRTIQWRLFEPSDDDRIARNMWWRGENKTNIDRVCKWIKVSVDCNNLDFSVNNW